MRVESDDSDGKMTMTGCWKRSGRKEKVRIASGVWNMKRIALTGPSLVNGGRAKGEFCNHG